MNVLSAPGEIFFRIFAAAHLNESYADRPLSFLLGFDFYRVLTLVAHWETNYSMADGRAWARGLKPTALTAPDALFQSRRL